MATVVAELRYIFGLRTEVTNNLTFLDDHTILFPCGDILVRYNIDQAWQKFIQGIVKSQGIQAMALAANRLYLAVSEPGERATITIYDLQNEQSKKRMVLTGTDATMQEFVCMAFSPDSKYLIGQSGGPEWTLVFWLWKKRKVMCTMKTSSPDYTVSQVSFNPGDHTQFCVSGIGVFKLFRYADGVLKQSRVAKVEVNNVLCHTWLAGGQLIAGTDAGRLLVFDSGYLRSEISVGDEASEDPRREEEPRQEDETVPAVPEDQEEAPPSPCITAILPYSTGFICSAGPGTVCLFEKAGDKYTYRKTNELRMRPDPHSPELSCSQQHKIVSMCVSPSQETLVASTQQGQLFSAPLTSAEVTPGEPAHLDFLPCSYHTKAITGLSTCISKPLISTCSLDCSIHIWNFQTKELKQHKVFQEEVHSVALHPSGLFILAAFSNQLTLMSLVPGDLRPHKMFSVPGCQECVFSHGGHLFAAASGNVIRVYSVTTFENVFNLKGHTDKVRAVAWSLDDNWLVSCGADGSVHRWNTYHRRSEQQSVLCTCSYHAVAVGNDGRTVYATGSDLTLKEIQDGQILTQAPSGGVAYTALAVLATSGTGGVVFVGTASGSIRLIGYPVAPHNDWVEHQAHGAAVTKMVVTYDQTCLVTASEDGSLLLWEITHRQGRGLQRDLVYSEELLIRQSDLQEQNQTLINLQTEVNHKEMDRDYKLHLMEMSYTEEATKMSELLTQQQESIKAKNQAIKTELDKKEVAHRQNIADITEKHLKLLRDMETSQKKTLMQEEERHVALQDKFQAMQEDYERRLEAVKESNLRALEELPLSYEARLEEKARLTDQQDQATQERAKFEETLKLMEEDGKEEMFLIRTKFESLLRPVTEACQKLNEQEDVMKEQSESMKLEINSSSVEVQQLNEQLQKLQSVEHSQKENIEMMMKSTSDVETAIMNSYQNIKSEMKMLVEKEKELYLVENKLLMLEEQMDSQQKEIGEMCKTKEKMEANLDHIQKKNTQQKRTTVSLSAKLKNLRAKWLTLLQERKLAETQLRRIKVDLHSCSAFGNDISRLKSRLIQLYQHYGQEGEGVKIRGLHKDVSEDQERQRAHLERELTFVETTLSRSAKLCKRDDTKLAQRHVYLIEENNRMRAELRVMRSKSKSLPK